MSFLSLFTSFLRSPFIYQEHCLDPTFTGYLFSYQYYIKGSKSNSSSKLSTIKGYLLSVSWYLQILLIDFLRSLDNYLLIYRQAFGRDLENLLRDPYNTFFILHSLVYRKAVIGQAFNVFFGICLFPFGF